MKCPQKSKFISKAKARKYQTLYNSNRDGYKMHVYKCRQCGNYHLSKFRGKIRYSNICDKHVYHHIKDAELVRDERKAAGEPYLRVYPCKKCHGYHITKRRK